MGKDEREGNSPSFFNAEEAATVTSYLKLLLTSSFKKGKARLSPRNVGVISPYRKQVKPSVPIKSGPLVPRQYFIHSQTTSWRFQELRPLRAQRSVASPSLPPGSLASCLTPSCMGVMAGERKAPVPIFQVEKIRHCITRLDRELRGLNDIKDLKVTLTTFTSAPCLPCPSLPHSRSPPGAPALMFQASPCPTPKLAWVLPKPLTPGDPNLWFWMGPGGPCV